MPISEKIKKHVTELNIDNDMKKLMLDILAEEDIGSYSVKKAIEKIVDTYLEKKDGDNNDSNN